MTSSIRNNPGSARTPGIGRRTDRRTDRSGFTLVELLVVIGIILVLMSILLPGLNRVWKVSVRSRMQADIQVISIALDAYRADFDQYPQVVTPGYGADTLFFAMMGPNAQGFRVRAGGKLYQPYLPADRFKYNITTNPVGGQILDRYKHPILYYPARKGPAIAINPQASPTDPPQVAYVGSSASPGVLMMYNANDNSNTGGLYNMPSASFQRIMGASQNNGFLLPGETPAYIGDYVVLSAGPDENYGPADNTKPISPSNRCDDVTNYGRGEN